MRGDGEVTVPPLEERKGLHPERRLLVFEDVGIATELLKKGWDIDDIKIHLGFTGTDKELQIAFKWHGFLIVRMLEKVELKRTWQRRPKIGRFTPEQLAKIDEWLHEYPELFFTIRLCRFHFNAFIYDRKTFDLWLLRSGYAWRYTVRENKKQS